MGMLTSALTGDQMDPQAMRMRAALTQFQGALQSPDVRGGLLTNEQAGAMSPDAQGLVNHTAGGQFGGLPSIPQFTPLDEQKAISAGMENHDFNGAVARQDANGRAYFADPTEAAPLDGEALRGAEAGLQSKGFLQTPDGWRPSPGRAEQVRRAPGAIAARPQAGGQLLQNPAEASGIPSEAVRRGNVTARAQSRGLQRDFNNGTQSPESLLLNQLKNGGEGMNGPMGAGMMFGPGAFIAATQNAENARQHADTMQQANSVQGVVNRYLANGGDPTQVGSVVEAWKQGQGGAPQNPLVQNQQLDPLVGAHQNTYQGYIKYMKAAQANGIDPKKADAAWKAQGRTTEQGVFSGASSNPLVNAGDWLGSLFTGVR